MFPHPYLENPASAQPQAPLSSPAKRGRWLAAKRADGGELIQPQTSPAYNTPDAGFQPLPPHAGPALVPRTHLAADFPAHPAPARMVPRQWRRPGSQMLWAVTNHGRVDVVFLSDDLSVHPSCIFLAPVSDRLARALAWETLSPCPLRRQGRRIPARRTHAPSQASYVQPLIQIPVAICHKRQP